MELIREHKDIDRDVCHWIVTEGTCDGAYKLGLLEAIGRSILRKRKFEGRTYECHVDVIYVGGSHRSGFN